MAAIDFWHDFGSSYSYVAAMRIEQMAAAVGVGIRWRPFLLGAIFKTQGWSTSPFNLQEAKGRYMWRDLERTCSAMGLAFRRPDPFPQSGLLASRISLIGHDEGWGVPFSKQVFLAGFGEGRRIDDRSILAEFLLKLHKDPDPILALAENPETKARLRSETAEAERLGIFGAPTFVAEDGELFWGNDRLEQALHWARHGSLQTVLR